MNIKMFDVNFGETILYQEGIHKLLVDCGAKYHNKGKLAYKRIEKEIDQNTMLMITHFDEDHYNGILEIPRDFHFRKVFLPLYIYEKGKQSNTMEVFIDTLYVWTYMMAIGKKKKIDSLHKLFLTLPKLVNSIYDIHCVGKDDNIYMGSKNIEVLWPQDNSNIKNKLYNEEFLAILRASVEEKQKDLLEMFVANANKYVSLLVKIYRFFCNAQNDIQYFELDRNDFYQEFHTLEVLYDTLLQIRLDIQFDERAINRVNYICSTKIRNMNECSIVFRIGKDIIAFGDVTPRIIKYLRQNKGFLDDKYKIIKVQHHGTKSYWSNDIPKAKRYLVSNSGNKNIRWSVYEKYGKEYTPKMICTNDNKDRCEYSKSGKCCVNCNVGIGKTQFIIDTNTL